ncbi:MAG TPA: DUF1697 domain-containing protein [Hanamia sp.]|nr:DUF1697 domain-containing protein [Hanamia sp.]
METFVALLRGINLGGHNILPMAELKALCEDAGFKKVRTYIQSGNVIFETRVSEEKAVIKLQNALRSKLTNPISVMIRTIEELQIIIEKNPFPSAKPSQVGVLFLEQTVDKSIVQEFSKIETEEIVAGKREIYIHYPNGMGKSKLKFPKSAKDGTVRNINTVKKLAELGKKNESE